jgi:hypothetical protein
VPAVTAAQRATTRLHLTVQAFGVAVDVGIGGDRAEEVVARMHRLWEFCRAGQACTGQACTGEARTRAAVSAVFDSRSEVLERALAVGEAARADLDDLLQLLTQRITLSAIDASAGACLMLHAACLADPRTRTAAAFVAPGGTGKTTLVRTLGPGRWYLTDETTVVMEDRMVVPYPKPLSVRRSPDSLFKNETPPSQVGLAPPTGPVRLGALCILNRDDEHEGPPAISTLTTLDAVMTLVPQCSHLPEMPQPLQRLAALCESVGGVHRVTYRESADLAGWLDQLVKGVA